MVTDLEVKSSIVAMVDTQHLRENIMQLRKIASCDLFMAVVKTNAYGHGIVTIAKEALRAGVNRLGVSTVAEGVQLRKSGIIEPVQILGTPLPDQIPAIIKHDLIASVSTLAIAKNIQEQAVKQQKQSVVHVKIDTGLHRFGIQPAEARLFCEELFQLSNVYPEGIYTHFSNADEGDWEETEKQFHLFTDTTADLAANGFEFAIHHAGASTIAMERSDMHLDMIRPGIALTGYHPGTRQIDKVPLKPLLTLKTSVLQLNYILKNTAVGYGGEFITKRKSKIAVIAIGHGHGYSRALSDNGQVLIGGRYAPIVGTISLDQSMVDVTDIANVIVGDEVVLIGKQGREEISARDVAGWMGSIVDEVLANISDRIPRRYI